MTQIDTISLITSSRADYGLLRNILLELCNQDKLDFNVIKIKRGSVQQYTKVEFQELNQEQEKYIFESNQYISSYPEDVIQFMSETMRQVSSLFLVERPQLIMVLGDRFEILAAVIAAGLHGIPIAHISGGEVTLGSYDDLFRHSITKFSQIHFVKSKENRQLLISMGENPDSIHIVGNLAIDGIQNLDAYSRRELEDIYEVNFGKINFLVTYHPETQAIQEKNCGINELIAALDNFPEISLFFTSPGNDVGGREIDFKIRNFVDSRENAFYFNSLGQRAFLSFLRICDGLIGNSSSGIFEAPEMGIPSINIGNRQLGRELHDSIINTPSDRIAIESAIHILLGKKSLKDSIKGSLGREEKSVSQKIINVIQDTHRDSLLPKKFYQK